MKAKSKSLAKVKAKAKTQVNKVTKAAEANNPKMKTAAKKSSSLLSKGWDSVSKEASKLKKKAGKVVKDSPGASTAIAMGVGVLASALLGSSKP